MAEEVEVKYISELDPATSVALTDVLPVETDPSVTNPPKQTTVALVLGAGLSLLRSLSAAAGKIPYFTSDSAAGLLDLSTDTALGTSDTTLSTQKAVKTYADTKTTLAAVKSAADVADAIAKKHAVGDSIAASISDGDLTHSPDGNSIFDALALKAPLSGPTFTGMVGGVSISYSSTMTGHETINCPGGNKMVAFLDPNGADRNFTPGTGYLAGYEIVIVNKGNEAITFDLTGLDEALGGGQKKSFFYDGTNWH